MVMFPANNQRKDSSQFGHIAKPEQRTARCCIGKYAYTTLPFIEVRRNSVPYFLNGTFVRYAYRILYKVRVRIELWSMELLLRN
jgi:hypothetical protein